MGEQMRKRDVVAVGWEALGDLSDILAGLRSNEVIDALERALKKHWPTTSNQVIGKEARQLAKFYSSMQEGDRVYAAYGQDIRAVGVIDGPYTYEEDDFSFRFRRKVRWLSTTTFRTASKAGLRTTVASFTNALDIRAQAARHLQASAGVVEPEVTPGKPIRRDGPVDPLIAQLERKGQVVLYGPPGTGKTYHALQVAEALVAHASHGSTSPRMRSSPAAASRPVPRRLGSSRATQPAAAAAHGHSQPSHRRDRGGVRHQVQGSVEHEDPSGDFVSDVRLRPGLG
jgi:5-methylcytosine-specific restriction protein B